MTAADEAGIDVAFLRRDHRHGYDLPSEPEYEIGSLEGLPELI